MRAAPSRVLMEKLWDCGVTIKAFDPVAMAETKRIYGDRPDLILCENPDMALEGTDSLAILTEWNVFRSPDFYAIKKQLSHPVIFDGRNIYEPDQMKTLGIDYFGIGRGLSSGNTLDAEHEEHQEIKKEPALVK